MQTNDTTTYIFLERGDEDVRLYKEIEEIAKKYKSVVEFMKKCPVLNDLRQSLRNEIKMQYPDN